MPKEFSFSANSLASFSGFSSCVKYVYLELPIRYAKVAIVSLISVLYAKIYFKILFLPIFT